MRPIGFVLPWTIAAIVAPMSLSLPTLATTFVRSSEQATPGRWPAPRAGHVMSAGGSLGGVLLIGGQVGQERRTLDTLWEWSGSRWQALAADGPRYWTLPAAAFDSRRGVMVVFGGAGLLNGTRYGDTWECASAWCSTAGAPTDATISARTYGSGMVSAGRASHHRVPRHACHTTAWRTT